MARQKVQKDKEKFVPLSEFLDSHRLGVYKKFQPCYNLYEAGFPVIIYSTRRNT